MPREYANVDLWIKRYLSNDKSIQELIRFDGDDTAGILFTRFVEKQLQANGRSLDDVGTRRTIHKKQFASWSDFPRPIIKECFKPLFSLVNRSDLFAILAVQFNGSTFPYMLASMNCKGFYLDFSVNGSECHVNLQLPDGLHLSYSSNSAENVNIGVAYHEPVSGFSQEHTFSVARGTSAAICTQFGKVTSDTVSHFGKQLSEGRLQEGGLQRLFSFIGAAYFEKCSRMEKILADLHKVAPTTYIRLGLVKLAPDTSNKPFEGKNDLKFPQVDMFKCQHNQCQHMHPFSLYQEPSSAFRQFSALCCVNDSANEHQIIKEIYDDPFAISTVKLLQIAHQDKKDRAAKQQGDCLNRLFELI